MITECNEKGEGRTGSVEYQGNKIIVKSTRVFELFVDDPDNDDQYIIANGPSALPDPLPTILSAHPTNPVLKCKSIPVRQEPGEGKAANCWRATVEYDNQTSDQDAEDSETPPLDRRTRWVMRIAQATKVIERDIDGNLIANTVGDQFDPPLEEEDHRPVLVATKNYDATDLPGLMSLIADYSGAVNSDEFLGLPPGSWYLSAPDMSPEQVENDVRYHEVSWAFELKSEYEISDPSTVEGTPEPWDRLVLNVGYRAYQQAESSETVYNVVSSKDQVKLKETGVRFGHDDDPNYFYRTFRTKKRRAFSALGLT